MIPLATLGFSIAIAVACACLLWLSRPSRQRTTVDPDPLANVRDGLEEEA
jgi:hypothetical protein